MKKELQDASVEPVFNPRKIWAAFYRRDKVPEGRS
jgi:hypothetical protein